VADLSPGQKLRGAVPDRQTVFVALPLADAAYVFAVDDRRI
jgi:hypothetical protein